MLSKIKEKKLNAIKTEIKEIKKYISSNDSVDISKQQNTDYLHSNVDDTLTLTKIVNDKNKMINNNDLYQIKKELIELKSAIDDNKHILKEILSKVK